MERSAISHCPIVALPKSDRTVPIMASPEWSCSEVSAAPADNHVLFFGGVVFELGNNATICLRRLLCLRRYARTNNAHCRNCNARHRSLEHAHSAAHASAIERYGEQAPRPQLLRTGLGFV